ncbi:MAG: chorismate dehydratase [Blastocatellia bacterium]|jgi:chorismate dehydratase|nr:chorismate dehydratase [Blastocatellia bacterium]
MKAMGKIIDGSREADAPRVAASIYLNSAPLIWSFTRGERRQAVRLVPDAAPARCADMLARGFVEAALVPVIEYQRIPEVLIVPNVCVGSRERVRSVVLVTRGAELKEARRVALDTSSRTSATLTRVIFREFFGFEPEWKAAAPDLDAMLNEADAALLIGDPAMTFAREGLRVYDLASIWREKTGLGFVFAMWMAREDAAHEAREIDFAGARDEGLASVEEIAAAYEPLLRLPRAELRSYLLENISFSLDAEMKAGLDLFYKLAHKHGLLDAVRPLRMLDDVSD